MQQGQQEDNHSNKTHNLQKSEEYYKDKQKLVGIRVSVTVANRKNALTAKSTVTEQRGPQNFVCLQMKSISTKLHH